VTPVSRHHRRGQSIDRYYIMRFLTQHAADIRGHVLEVGSSTYTARVGGNRVTHSTVLHKQEASRLAAIVADLSDAPQMASATFDCIILTQVLQRIPDMRAALRTVHRILKPGGVLLASVPSVSQIWHHPSDSWHEMWRMTDAGARYLLAESFPDAEISAHGNALAAIALLHGLAVDELRRDELDFVDWEYQIVVLIRAVKRPSETLHAGA